MNCWFSGCCSSAGGAWGGFLPTFSSCPSPRQGTAAAGHSPGSSRRTRAQPQQRTAPPHLIPPQGTAAAVAHPISSHQGTAAATHSPPQLTPPGPSRSSAQPHPISPRHGPAAAAHSPRHSAPHQGTAAAAHGPSTSHPPRAHPQQRTAPSPRHPGPNFHPLPRSRAKPMRASFSEGQKRGRGAAPVIQKRLVAPPPAAEDCSGPVPSHPWLRMAPPARPLHPTTTESAGVEPIRPLRPCARSSILGGSLRSQKPPPIGRLKVKSTENPGSSRSSVLF